MPEFTSFLKKVYIYDYTAFFCRWHLPFSAQFVQCVLPRRFQSPTPFSSQHLTTQLSSQHFITIPSQSMPTPSHSTRPGQSFQSLFQTQQIHKSSATSLLNQFNLTHSSYLCFFGSFQNCHLILPQTSCLAPIQNCQSYTTVITFSFFSFFYF